MPLETTDLRVRSTLYGGFVAARGLEHVVAGWADVCRVCGGTPDDPADRSCDHDACHRTPMPERPMPESRPLPGHAPPAAPEPAPPPHRPAAAPPPPRRRARTGDPLTLSHDDLWPREDPNFRYRLYGRTGANTLAVLAAAPDAGGIGVAIFTLHNDAKLAGGTLGDSGQIGIYDALNSEWIVVPFNRGESPLAHVTGAHGSTGATGVTGPAGTTGPVRIDLPALRSECEYSPYGDDGYVGIGDGSVDSLIAYKDALEDTLLALPDDVPGLEVHDA